jgi:hypothetical protein
MSNYTPWRNWCSALFPKKFDAESTKKVIHVREFEPSARSLRRRGRSRNPAKIAARARPYWTEQPPEPCKPLRILLIEKPPKRGAVPC